MLNVYVYGFLKKKFNSEANLSENTIIKVEYKEHETFAEFLKRMNILETELGDCFINGKIAEKDKIIIKDARIGLFSFGMRLLDGGQHIKGHGYVTKDITVKINTWNSLT